MVRLRSGAQGLPRYCRPLPLRHSWRTCSIAPESGLFAMPDSSISRRGFVGSVAATGVAASLSSTARLAASPAADKVRFALIGAGSRANQLLDQYLKRDDCDFLYVVDVDDRHASTTADRVAQAKGNKP